MVWYGMVWFGMVWYDMIWFEFNYIQTRCFFQNLHEELNLNSSNYFYLIYLNKEFAKSPLFRMFLYVLISIPLLIFPLNSFQMQHLI